MCRMPVQEFSLIQPNPCGLPFRFCIKPQSSIPSGALFSNQAGIHSAEFFLLAGNREDSRQRGTEGLAVKELLHFHWQVSSAGTC